MIYIIPILKIFSSQYLHLRFKIYSVHWCHLPKDLIKLFTLQWRPTNPNLRDAFRLVSFHLCFDIGRIPSWNLVVDGGVVVEAVGDSEE